MSLYRPKKSPYWHYDFQWHGVRFHGSTGCAKKRAAEAVERHARNQATTGQAQSKRAPISLSEAAERYFVEIAKDQASARTTDYQLENLVRGLGPGLPLSEIEDGLPDYIARRRGQSTHGRGRRLVANATINREVQLLRRVLRRADRTWKRDVGEMPDWSALLLPEPEGRVRTLGPDEERRLLDTLRPELVPVVRFALATGLRLDSVMSLTWTAADREPGEIAFQLKGRTGKRRALTVPLTPGLRALIEGARGHHPIFVFTYLCQRGRAKRRKGERYPFSRSGWRKDWRVALAAAGIEDFRFHDLRHTDATRTLRKTGNLKLVQKKLGHASIASTARYAHVTTADVHAAMLVLEHDAEVDSESRNSPGAAPAQTTKTLKSRA